MKKKLVAVLTATTIVAGMLSGCGQSEEKSANGKEKITFWFPTFSAVDAEIGDQEFWEGQMEAFEKENNCEVSVEIIPWDNYEEKYLTGTTSDDGPDVGYMYMEMFYDYIEQGTLTDIDEYFTDEEKENYLYYDLGNILEGQYALPVVVGNPRILVANMDILKEAGVEKVPSNWDELVEACKTVQASNPDVVPLAQDWGNPHFGSLNEIYWPYFWGAGASIVDEDGNLTIDSPEGLEATEFLYNLKKDGILVDSVTSCDDVLALFRNGEAAMAVVAAGNALTVDTVNWDFQPLIEGPKDKKTMVAADSLVMFEKCENKELAAKLMKYVTSGEVMAEFHEKVSEQPPIAKDETYAGDERFEKLYSDYGDNFTALPVFKGSAAMYDSLYKNLQSMMLGDLTPEEVLKQTTEYYNTNLK